MSATNPNGNTQLNTLRIGDSYQFIFSPFSSTRDENGEVNTLTDWTCTIYVKATPGGADLITPRAVAANATLTGFYGYLTDTETSALNAGTVFLIAEMDNGTKHSEQREKITVLEAWN